MKFQDRLSYPLGIEFESLKDDFEESTAIVSLNGSEIGILLFEVWNAHEDDVEAKYDVTFLFENSSEIKLEPVWVHVAEESVLDSCDMYIQAITEEIKIILEEKIDSLIYDFEDAASWYISNARSDNS